ncbi:MAG: 30S ribosomal protein S13 [Nanoarchaeota archaeon]|nr:30S ribosomal protein S13 [Nanoarchaeota archaeon]
MIVRFAEADLIGTKKVAIALTKVRGVGMSLAKAIVDVSGIDPNKLSGHLTEEEIKKLEEISLNPMKFGIHKFMVNRQKDPETGQDMHKLSSDLIFTKKTDIDSMKKIQCYKGIRHQLGLPVRGQRTRSSFRTGAKVGVVKKKEQPKSAPKK